MQRESRKNKGIAKKKKLQEKREKKKPTRAGQRGKVNGVLIRVLKRSKRK